MAKPTSSPAPEHDEVRGSFRIFRSPPEKALSAADRRSFNSLAIAAPNERPEGAQLAVEHGNLWVLSTDRLLCLAQPKGAACAPKRVAIREGVLLGTFQPPTTEHPVPHNFLLQGVVPDDVKKVQVVIGRNHLLIANVKGNVFAVERDQPVHLKRLLRG